MFDMKRARAVCRHLALVEVREVLPAALDEIERLTTEGPRWLACAIAVMHESVDLTDPRCPVGAALTRAGLERVPYQARIDYEELIAERDQMRAVCEAAKVWARHYISDEDSNVSIIGDDLYDAIDALSTLNKTKGAGDE